MYGGVGESGGITWPGRAFGTANTNVDGHCLLTGTTSAHSHQRYSWTRMLATVVVVAVVAFVMELCSWSCFLAGVDLCPYP